MTTLVGTKAPDFSCCAVRADGSIIEDFHLASAIKGKYGVLVFYPLDFTFVCPSELIALDHRMEQLRERKTEVIAVSVDSQHTHLAWRKTPVDQGGIGSVGYTMAADLRHEVCKAYGVESKSGVAYRATFLIDRDGVVRAQVVNDLPLGRNMDELIRVIDALQHHEKHGEVCPAGWKKGDTAMRADSDGVARYLAEHGERL